MSGDERADERKNYIQVCRLALRSGESTELNHEPIGLLGRADTDGAGPTAEARGQIWYRSWHSGRG